MLTGRMRSATTRHVTCTGLGLTSQATCLARIPLWRMRRWMTELLKACGWVTTSAPPCSGCTRSSFAKWYVSALIDVSDPRHFDHILPFLCPEDIPHRIDLSANDICTMHEEDGDTVQRMPLRKSTRFRITTSCEPVLVTPDSDALDVDSGENSGELKTGEPDAAEQDKESPSAAQHKVLLGPNDYDL